MHWRYRNRQIAPPQSKAVPLFTGRTCIKAVKLQSYSNTVAAPLPQVCHPAKLQFTVEFSHSLKSLHFFSLDAEMLFVFLFCSTVSCAILQFIVCVCVCVRACVCVCVCVCVCTSVYIRELFPKPCARSIVLMWQNSKTCQHVFVWLVIHLVETQI